ncbi:MAG: hypothetical protein GY754_23080, partial [bacterium]|nr:hypothetical protein [bacterium]
TTITWAATWQYGGGDASSVVNADGIVTRPPCNWEDAFVEVTLTAAVQKGSVGDSSVSFDYKVLKGDKLLSVVGNGEAGDQFGNSVSISDDGETVIVGTSYDDIGGFSNAGSAIIFQLEDNSWQEKELAPSDPAAGALYGRSVAISSEGDTVLMGAVNDDDNGANSGSAYIYSLVGNEWDLCKLVPSGGAAGDYFGETVAISSHGNTIAVGAYGDGGVGSVSIYRYRVWSNWDIVKLNASDAASGDQFGKSVAITDDGNTVVVGAWNDDDNGSNSGSVYIYKWDGSDWDSSDAWIETKLTASEGATTAQFGKSVAVTPDGNTVIVGAYTDDIDGKTNAGSACIYQWDGSQWNETKLAASGGEADDQFGVYVSIASDGNTAIVGAFHDDDKAENAGAAYIFRWDGSSWIESEKITAPDGEAGDNFGVRVDITPDGNTVIIGAFYDDDRGTNSGSAYVFRWNGICWQ